MLGQMVTEQVCPDCGGAGKKIKAKCDFCLGKGYTRKPAEIEVNIPGGVEEGQVVYLKGQGEAGKNGGPNGDIIVNLKIAPSPIFTRSGADLFVELPIPFTTALLGGVIKLPLVDDTIYELRIPELTQPNTVLTIRGKGAKVLNREAYGSIYVKVIVEMPKSISKEQRKTIEELDDGFDKKDYPKSAGFSKRIE